MKRETYCDLKRRPDLPNFDQRYTMEVPIVDIEFDVYNSQIRQKGHVFRKVSSMAQSILKGGQETPISVIRKGNGKYELKDGATRVLAMRDADLEKIRVSFYHDTLGWTADEWYDFQCSSNDHPPQTSNSEEDIKAQIQYRVDNGGLERTVGFKYIDQPEEFLKRAAAHLKTVYKHGSGGGYTIVKYRNFVKKALSGTISSMYENYDKRSAMTYIKNQNKVGWATAKQNTKNAIGDISNNICFYPCADIGREVRKDAFANAAYKRIDNPTVKAYMVYWVGDLTGKDDEKIKSERETCIREYDKINGKYHVFAGLYFLPQFKTGVNKENLYHMRKVR